jgi:predicted ATPase
VLTKLRVANFKNLADVSAEFGPLNVIIGPNGSGKSSLLQAIDFLRGFFCPALDVYLNERGFDYADLPNLRQRGKAIRWELTAELGPDAAGNSVGTYEYAATAMKRRFLGVGEERLTYRAAGRDPLTLVERSGRSVVLRPSGDPERTARQQMANLPRSVLADLTPGERRRFPAELRFRDWVTGFRSFLLWDPKILRRPDRGKHMELGPSGEHLAPVLAGMRREEPESFRRLATRARRLFPTVSDIGASGGKYGWQRIDLAEGSVRFNSEQMSDGVLRLLSVLALVHSKRVPPLVTFEEPENGMHPQLVEEVVGLLRELSQRKPPGSCQVLFTTHSPYVLDHFIDCPEQVYVMERGRPQEGARLCRLTDRRDIDVVKATFKHSLGEAWYSGLIGGTAR